MYDNHNPLGKVTLYPAAYDPTLLFAIDRSIKRKELHIGSLLPFTGVDVWISYELSWLNPRGKPQVALAKITIPAHSPCIIESKSLKLYLNSLNNTVFADISSVKKVIEETLSHVAKAPCTLDIWEIENSFQSINLHRPQGLCLDGLDITCTHYVPCPSLLRTCPDVANETLYSHLLKSNCPITNQPDWASVFIQYKGPRIDHSSLLAYIVSFRNHNGFHEHCVEHIFMDILAACKPESLTVYAQYTRRGGLDINPYRTNQKNHDPFDFKRLIRQ